MKLIVGLGNPGPEYAATRHNAGFWVVDQLAAHWTIDGWREKFFGLWTRLRSEGQDVMLLKPLTFMNRSGCAVRDCVDYYQVAVSELLVVVDDVYLELGRVRVRPSGSDGGHNGLRSVSAAVGTTEYARLRIGIGAPEHNKLLADYVLSKPYSAAEQQLLNSGVSRARDAALLWVSHGMSVAMSRINGSNTGTTL